MSLADARAWLAARTAGVRSLWRRSLQTRVVLTSLVLSVLVVLGLGWLLLGRVTNGLLAAKERASLEEARAGLVDAQSRLDAADRTDGASASVLLDQIARQLANRAGSPPLYEVLLLGSATSAQPELGTNLVSPASVPADLRTAIEATQRISWTYTSLTYADGRPPVPGFVVGGPLTLQGVGPYELYYLFPLTQEQQTLALVQRTLLAAGGLLVGLLGAIAWLVTRQVVQPVRVAARTAERFSAGRLQERMAVTGEDDLARLATAFNDMAASLQQQIRRLEDLSRVQQRFVSDVSHELRTPLTTVRMAADVLHEARTTLPGDAARSSELLQAQLERFEALLTDLLEISRYDAGGAVLEAEAVDVRDLVRRAVDAVEPLAERNGCRVSVRAPAIACIAEVDARRVDRVLRNLLVNAVEHGSGKPVEVRVAADAVAVAIGVRDYGPGLRPGESSLVFNRFWRADPARARSTGGTGLGLAIAYEDARLHGGWLEAWGEPGDGAHFRLTLPRRARADLPGSPLPLEPFETVVPTQPPGDVGATAPSRVATP